MMNSSHKHGNKGFTLIELLVVVVIIGILAAVVIPQLSGVSSDSKEKALQANLGVLRSSIDLYYQQHGHYPGNPTAVSTCLTGPGTGTGADVNGLTFAEQLSMYTDATGKACSATDTTYKFGPYIKAPATGLAAIPKNPITDSAAVKVVTTGNLSMTGNAVPAGWLYDKSIGKIIADDAAYDHL